MVRNTKVDNFSDSDEAPDEIEHGLIKDSVLEIAKADFTLDEVEDLPLGNIRKAVSNVDYVGKPVSRKTFESRNWIEEEGSEDDEDSDDLDSEADSFDNASILNDSDPDEENLSGAESFEDDEEEASEEGSETQYSEKSEDESENNESGDDGAEEEKKPEIFEGINIFSDKVKDVETDVKKGKAIKNQLLIWEHLIESRIKFQKAVQSCNTFYQADKYPDFMNSLSTEESEVVRNAERKFKELLEILVQVDDALLKNCGDYQKFKKNQNISKDKEAASDDCEGPPEKRLKQGLRQRFGMKGPVQQWRDTVLETWNDRANLAAPRSARYSILEGSILRQLEHALADRTTLIARTRIRRGGELALGKKVKQAPEELPTDAPQEHHRTKVPVEDPELFNDDDFYHKLLKDFIDRKTSNITDPSQLGREWTKLEKMRSKLKRTVDTRATKGRRLRYTVHQKLVNFMAPIRYWTMDDAVEADLFRSLFGQAATVALPSKNVDVANAAPA